MICMQYFQHLIIRIVGWRVAKLYQTLTYNDNENDDHEKRSNEIVHNNELCPMILNNSIVDLILNLIIFLPAMSASVKKGGDYYSIENRFIVK